MCITETPLHHAAKTYIVDTVDAQHSSYSLDHPSAAPKMMPKQDSETERVTIV
jgi:hypothetical protein